LGDERLKYKGIPTLVTYIKGKVLSVSCGYYHTGAISINNSAFTWGSNKRGQLGLDHLVT